MQSPLGWRRRIPHLQLSSHHSNRPQTFWDASHAWEPGTPSADKQAQNSMQQELIHVFGSSKVVVNQQVPVSCSAEVKLPTDMPCSSHHQSEVEEVEQGGGQARKSEMMKVKRKKHRPKVVREGRSMKRKPVTPDQVPPKPPVGKRMRKRKGLNSVDGISGGVEKSDIENCTRSARRRLSFKSEGRPVDEYMEPMVREAESHARGICAGFDNISATAQIGHGMQHMMENPTAAAAGITLHLDHSQMPQEELIRLPPIQPSRRALLMRNWKYLARKLLSSADNFNFVEPTKWQTGPTSSSDTRCNQETTQVVIWHQTSSHFPQLYKGERRRRMEQDKDCDPLMKESSMASESVFICDKLLQPLEKPPQSDNYIDIKVKEQTKMEQLVLHPFESMDHVHKLSGGFYRFLEQSSIGLTAAHEKNLLHPISDPGIVSNFEEPDCTNLIYQARVPYAHRTEEALSQGISTATPNALVPIAFSQDINTGTPNGIVPISFSQDISTGTPNALVPYGGQFDEIKKRRTRAKVDLDEESNRMWNLLMGKEGSDVGDESDVNNEQWEEQRRLLCDRVDSFIQLMHLVQGDRRFSQWKGSILDSVVGVFLTQNVSDTLSSSAFMCLAAKFPLRDNDIECNAESMQQEGSLPPSTSGDTEAKREKTDDSFNGKNNSDGKEKNPKGVDWDSLRKEAYHNGYKLKTTAENRDSLDWEAVRSANVKKISEAIQDRGQNNILAERIKDFLNRLFREHGSLDLEWLRYVPPDKTKDFLLSIRGLGLKSVECIRLLALNQVAFPVDTNVARICVRLGWVPIQPLPEELQLHLLELYPVMENVQKYIWPRLCKLDQRTLYELHYQMITFGKVFCTKRKPNCHSCPMKTECRHFASASASATHALPAPSAASTNDENGHKLITLPQPQDEGSIFLESVTSNHVPGIELPSMPRIEEPSTPEPECMQPLEIDIEDTFCEDPDNIPEISINLEEFGINLQNYMKEDAEFQDEEMSKSVVAISTEAASIPIPKLKYVSRLRTEHHVYELPDSHPLLEGLDRREPDDPCPYLLSIWTPGETSQSIEPPETCCNFQDVGGKLCEHSTCFSCSSKREAQAQIVRGTLLIPCRTAMRGRFPLNGTYFQVNEVFADDETSHNPIDVPRKSIWNLPRRSVYMGSATIAIFREQRTQNIMACFGSGFICTRGFDRRTRSPRPICKRLHNLGSKAPPKSQKGPAKEAVKNRQSSRT